jgi:cephalosporin-C deacetylase-like acetyl esterase
MELPTGSRLGHYEIRGLLGQGGMGEVYRARDTRLGREVALKILPAALARDPERLARFQREAKALAAIDHPGIVTVFSVEEADAVHFLTMQLVDGMSLDRGIPERGFPVDRLLDIGIGLTEAVAAAHDKGIVHRDLKPANVMMTMDGRVKVLDFGLAKEVRLVEPDSATLTSGGQTAVNVVMGTPAYMSPEQVTGRPIDHRTDIFAVGIILYELATGRRPFAGVSQDELASAILRETPRPVSELRPGLPEPLVQAIARCLEKDASARFQSATALLEELRRLRRPKSAAQSPFARPAVLVPAVLVVLALIAFAGWTMVSRSRRAVLVAEALPRIEALARTENHLDAFNLLREVERVGHAAAIPDHIWTAASARVTITSTPAGARVTVRALGGEGEPIELGVTPLNSIPVPRGVQHWRAEQDGHVSADLVTAAAGPQLNFVLPPVGVADAGMVTIPAASVRLFSMGGVKPQLTTALGAYLIDRHEVSNEEYARFVTAGGYERAEFWKHEFRDGDRVIPFREAMARFVDLTGRPGPATWRVGSFPDGQKDMPVTGVSWYEAAAYAAFAGKELPTVYHWYYADTGGDIQLLPGLLLARANLEGTAPRPVNASGSVSAFGAIDMAGNVREWSANASAGTTRIALGGAWSDPTYTYLIPEVLSPFDRSPGNGLRCMKRTGPDPQHEMAMRALPAKPRIDRTRQQPVGDAEYRVFTRFFERQRVPLDPRIELTDDSAPHWIKQKVSFAAGYGGERLTAWLYLPKSAGPPYQVIIQMGGAATFYRRSSTTEQEIFGWHYADPLIRGGRAVMVPLWKGSYERSDGFHPFESEWPVFREHVIKWVTELRQSVDYLQTRDDIEPSKIGYQGISFGTVFAPIFMAMEPRVHIGIFLIGGLLSSEIHTTPMPAEVDSLNYAPRVSAPVLMLAGRYDAVFPYETSQVPLFQLLGTPSEDKRHDTFPGGHSSAGWVDERVKRSLAWLDQHFGPPARAQ